MGYRLKVVAGPGTGSECDLEESEITIGRAPENGMVINDTNVSRVHAKFSVAPGNKVIVADNGSRNGVYVNDRKVNQQPLSPGDRVVIGQSVIELVADGVRGGSGSGKTGRAAPQPARRPNGNGSVVAAKGGQPAVQGRTGAVQRAGRAVPKPASKGPPVPLMIGRQTTLQPPQLLGSDWMLAQKAPQQSWEPGQPAVPQGPTHWPPSGGATSASPLRSRPAST